MFPLETGIAAIGWKHIVMILSGIVLLYLAIEREMEPYELLPISLGIILTNLPLAGIMPSTFEIFEGLPFEDLGLMGPVWKFGVASWAILPPLLFLGLGAMTDFNALLSRPKTFILGAAAQVGIFISFLGALALGFPIPEAASIGIIGSADGPTTIYTASQLAPQLIGITAVAAYSYMAMVAIIQPPIIKALTTEEERKIRMESTRKVSDTEKLLFPLVSMIFIILIVPRAGPLIGMFMVGNLFRESGVVDRLSDTAGGDLMNIATIFLMFSVGASMSAGVILRVETIGILLLGLVAFAAGTAFGTLFGKLMNYFTEEKINPMIGAAGVSAVPMAARNVQNLGREADQHNNLLMHAMGPNLAGVVGSATVAGILLGMI
ncbi:glutaconyl-CoA decarboxylase subunit beta [candidate division MSBL1 archaeon SCGC-AAA259J03]|uniref:Glutaconyl-CoA decarboxylase subunit beta n=2 Tax=candidate division MSBL1 TaxID=215777 RepID=A0A656YWZ5_9EURY|nr:glutaconyl-CoA decarboxylase subunit beta [candidate division MSBL1 archaeon SCGC-AAA259J03]